MIRGKIGGLIIVILCAMMLSACSVVEEALDEVRGEKLWEPGETALQIRGDGTLTETVIDRLDQTYYSFAELERMIESTVSDYNQRCGADAVTVDSFVMEENQIVLTMSYRSAQDYADYNNVAFYNGPMLEAEIAGFRFYHTFRKVEKGTVAGSDVAREIPLKHKEYQVLVTDASHLVQVPGDIEYLSSNAGPLGERKAGPLGETAEPQQEGLLLPSSAVYVEENISSPEMEKEAGYIYVLYDF